MPCGLIHFLSNRSMKLYWLCVAFVVCLLYNVLFKFSYYFHPRYIPKLRRLPTARVNEVTVHCALGSYATHLLSIPPPSTTDCAAIGLFPRAHRATLIDTVMVNNEAEVLLLRLLELDSVVDAFVVVESRNTFTGLAKNLVLDEFAGCFKRWEGRIHRIVAQPPNGSDAWAAEAWLRNMQAEGVAEMIATARSNPLPRSSSWARDADILFAVSDVDEIPRPEAYEAAASCTGYHMPIAFQLDRFFYYNFNWLKRKSWFMGPRIFSWEDRLKFPAQSARNLALIPHSPEDIFVRGGWHIGYFMSPTHISQKIAAFSHTDLNRHPFNTEAWIAGAAEFGYDLFNRTGEEVMAFSDCGASGSDLPGAVLLNWAFFLRHCPLTEAVGRRGAVSASAFHLAGKTVVVALLSDKETGGTECDDIATQTAAAFCPPGAICSFVCVSFLNIYLLRSTTSFVLVAVDVSEVPFDSKFLCVRFLFFVFFFRFLPASPS